MIRRHLARSALIVLVLAALLAACGSSQKSQPVPLSMLSEVVSVELIAPLETPTAFAIRPGDPAEIVYVASQNGAVYRVDVSSGGTSEVASLRDRTKASGERGLLGAQDLVARSWARGAAFLDGRSLCPDSLGDLATFRPFDPRYST
mgnify:CR=1 FL=1